MRRVRKAGRPPKFAEPRRPVTLTLPERTLRQLAAYDADRAKAIVRLAEAVLGGRTNGSPAVRLVEVAPETSVIIVGASRLLPRLRFIRRVEVSPGCYLLMIPTGTPIESVELELLDLIDDVPAADGPERALLVRLHDLLRRVRRGSQVSKAEILLVSRDQGGRPVRSRRTASAAPTGT